MDRRISSCYSTADAFPLVNRTKTPGELPITAYYPRTCTRRTGKCSRSWCHLFRSQCVPTSGNDDSLPLAEQGKSSDEPCKRRTDRFWGVKCVNKCAPGESSGRTVSNVADGASGLSPSCGFSLVFLANGEVGEPKDSGNTLLEHVEMTRLP